MRSVGRAVGTWTVALALLCSGLLLLEFHHIKSTLPYPIDIDEGFVSGPANRTLVEGNLHPYTFVYPSLPKYVAAVGMAAGFLRSASNLDLRQVQRIGNVGYPYYDVPGVMQGARQLFVLLSVLAMAATGAAGWLAFRRPSASRRLSDLREPHALHPDEGALQELQAAELLSNHPFEIGRIGRAERTPCRGGVLQILQCDVLPLGVQRGQLL